MSKTLEDKAIDIKGKKYVLVSDRVLYFNEKYPEGCIVTELINYENGKIIIKAKIYPDGVEVKVVDNNEVKLCKNVARCFTGYAQEVEGEGYINKTSALENAETSAVGRALAMMGIGVLDSIASVDEVNKAQNREAVGTCADCGAPMKLSKIGKPYCSAVCWKNKPAKTELPITEIGKEPF